MVLAGQYQDNVRLGIFLMLAAYTLFSFIDVGAKWLAVLACRHCNLPLCAMRDILLFRQRWSGAAAIIYRDFPARI